MGGGARRPRAASRAPAAPRAGRPGCRSAPGRLAAAGRGGGRRRRMAAPRGRRGARQPPGRERKVAERRHRRAPKFPARWARRAPLPAGPALPPAEPPRTRPPGSLRGRGANPQRRPGARWSELRRARWPRRAGGASAEAAATGGFGPARWMSRASPGRAQRAVGSPGPRAPTGRSGVRDRFDFSSRSLALETGKEAGERRSVPEKLGLLGGEQKRLPRTEINSRGKDGGYVKFFARCQLFAGV